MRAMLCIVNGERPLRPTSQSAPRVVRPSDGIWELITHCWDPISDSRPPMSYVWDHLKAELGGQDLDIGDKYASGNPGESHTCF
jgi:hypothetical protein